VLAGGKAVEVVLVSENARTVYTDPVKVRQVVINLTSNAAKFTEAGRIEIQQSYDAIANAIVIRVIDSGIGIREEDVDRLFEAFTQLEDAKSKRHEGTGLGLTITRELIHLLGGAISVESEFGHGTTFTIRIPDQKEQHS
jgi:signal transduction histidine kinase